MTGTKPLSSPIPLSALETPCLLLDHAKLVKNLEAMKAHLAALGVTFRPHLKTAKSVDVARLAITNPSGPAMVSTLLEAEYFADNGITDLIYGVGIAAVKLPRVTALRQRGVDLAVIVDNVDQARAVAVHATASGDPVPALIEVDPDSNRSGVAPDDAATLVAIGRALTEGGAQLRGVLLHAGASYALNDPASLSAAAEQERLAAVTAADHLRAAGLICPVVSIGSTPTASFARDLTGVTEVRAGVYMFQDLVQVGIGSASLDDIAISTLATVIGHQHDKGWILVDAGWMALSRDRGTASQKVDQGYGLVCDEGGKPFGDLIVSETNQEHGILTLRKGSTAKLPDLPVGTRVRIFPNHACATASQHDRYQVLDETGQVTTIWPRINGW